MVKLFSEGIEVSPEDLACLNNDLLNPEQWILDAIKGKVNNCKKRLINDWTQRFRQDPTIDQIPTSEIAFLVMVFEHPDYVTRIERDAIERASEV